MNEGLKKAITCPVCLEIYSDPRNLKCGHSLCFGCIANIIADTKLLVCPECRKEHGQIASAEDVPKMLSLQAIIESCCHPDVIPKHSLANTTADVSLCLCDECRENFSFDKLLFCPDHTTYICHCCCYDNHKLCVMNTKPAKEHFAFQLSQNVTHVQQLQIRLSAVSEQVKLVNEFHVNLGKRIGITSEGVDECMSQLNTVAQALQQGMENDAAAAKLFVNLGKVCSIESLSKNIESIHKEFDQICTHGLKLFEDLQNNGVASSYSASASTISVDDRSFTLALHLDVDRSYIIESCTNKGVLSCIGSPAGYYPIVKPYESWTNQQQWRLKLDVDRKAVLIFCVNLNNSLVLCVTDHDVAIVLASVAAFTGYSSQMFIIETVDREFCRIKHCASKRVLQVVDDYSLYCASNLPFYTGPAIIMSEYNGQPSQLWRFLPI